MKVVFQFNIGIIAYFANRKTIFVSPLFYKIHNFECKLNKIVRVNKGNLILCGVTILFSLILLEFYFKYFPETLSQAFGNAVASGYNTSLTGIYRRNPELKMNLMRPNYEREMFYNGYKWRHKTDFMGFRNPTNRETGEIVLLGDSMIYGHGVDETSTVRHHLENIINRPVINLGIQGNCIHQEYQVLKTFGVQLKPRYVFLFFLVNDISDLVIYFTDEEFVRFMGIPVENHTTPYYRIKPPRNKYLRFKFYIRSLYVYRAYDLLKNYMREFKLNKLWTFKLGEANASDNSWQSLPFFQDKSRYIHAMRFHLKTLLKIQDVANRNNFKFINVFIYTGHYEEHIYENILEDYCKSHGINFLSLRDSFVSELKNEKTLFLKGDGHFSDEGATLAAKIVVDYINTIESPQN
jgi:lysophospholipase L1-like esterase